MPERPLVLFAQPAIADKERKHGGSGNFYIPTHERQVARMMPKFTALQRALERGAVRMTNTPNAIDPEYTLVFETIGDPGNFYTAINKLKTQHPDVEWLMELSDSCPNSEDFYVIDNDNNRDDNKDLSTKIFCIMTNQAALAQILSLWNHYQNDEQFKFDRGLTGFRNLFKNLNDVHQWGQKERIEDTGVLEIWKEELEYDERDFVKTQIELFFRTSNEKQNLAEQKIVDIINSSGGNVVCKSLIPEIQYHAILAEIPRQYAQRIIEREEVDLVLADEIMFIKGMGQTAIVGISEQAEEEIAVSTPSVIYREPIVALFDGMPQENHPLLNDLITVDDPDSLSTNYPVDERRHGTSMASLILRGKDMQTISEEVHKIYVRPIMKSTKEWNGRIVEYIPNEFLLVDKIYECVRRLFEPTAGSVAPTIRVINLSIGISYREYYNLISPLARLLDWLSHKYRVLFIVSAGNHSEDIQLGMDFSSFSSLNNDEKDKFVIKYISENIRNFRFLSPAESLNALTVGSIFYDENPGIPLHNMTDLCSDGIPAVYSSFGRGINNAIKPDVLYPGGRSYIREDIPNPGIAKWVESVTRQPGIQSAYPNASRLGVGTTSYTIGTSNSTALISNQASECYKILNDVFVSETGENIPHNYAAVMIKAMLAHGACWSGLQHIYCEALDLSGRQTRNQLHKYLGYGVTDVDKVKECTKNQVTLIGYGDIKQGQAFVYSLPLPFDFHTQKYKRKLTVTLAYFSPTRASSIKYREKQVWFTINEGKNIAGGRAEYDNNAVQRGSLQHEIFESDSIEVWNEENALEIKVNCRGDASDKDEDVLIPYAVFATYEMAPEYDIDVYQAVVEKVHLRDTIITNME